MILRKQPLPAAGRVFARNQPDPGSELPALTKVCSVSDCRDECRCRKRPDAGDRVQALTGFTLLCGSQDQRIGILQMYGELLQLAF